VSGQDDVAVRVENVSKRYGLWSSPSARLRAPLLNAVSQPARLISNRLADRLSARSAGLMREFHALQDVSLEIRKGESWGFIGVNGSGKSTLLKIISGNLRPSAGRVEVDGKVAILDYSAGLHGEFTGRENVYLKGAILGMSRKEIEAKFKDIEAFADIGEFIDQPVKTYSSGMQARLGFAIISHVDADILITDEALAVGDAFFVQKCMRKIRQFLKTGTFLFVSHSTNDVVTLCEKAIWLEHGRVRAIGASKDVCRDYLNAIDSRISEQYLEASGQDDAPFAEQETGSPTQGAAQGFRPVRLSFSAADIAAIQDHFAAPATRADASVSKPSAFAISENMDPEFLAVDRMGVGGGKIVLVQMLDASGSSLSFMRGGEPALLRITAVAERKLNNPIIGFQLLNNRGVTLIGHNTSDFTARRGVIVPPGHVVQAAFGFTMPLLPVGDYVLRVGFADGEEANNAMLDLRNEALLLHCQTSGARHGLVGLPLTSIDISTSEEPVGFGSPAGP
jgi:lipopolysaccharide transport system ATP-binding protein